MRITCVFNVNWTMTNSRSVVYHMMLRLRAYYVRFQREFDKDKYAIGFVLNDVASENEITSCIKIDKPLFMQRYLFV